MTLPVGAQQHTETAPDGRLGRLLASTGVSLTGQGMVAAATPLLAATLTRDPLGVSLVTAATYAAWLVVGLPAGVLVDRWPRRLTMVVSDLVRAVLLGVLAVLVLSHSLSLPMLVAVVFLMGAAACFFDPAAQAAIPQLVGRETGALATANSRLWMLDVLGRSLIGPPAGAALFAAAASIPFGVNAFAFLISALLLTGLGSLCVTRPATGHPRLGESLAHGLRYLWEHRELRALTLGMGSFNLAYNTAFAILVLPRVPRRRELGRVAEMARPRDRPHVRRRLQEPWDGREGVLRHAANAGLAGLYLGLPTSRPAGPHEPGTLNPVSPRDA